MVENPVLLALASKYSIPRAPYITANDKDTLALGFVRRRGGHL